MKIERITTPGITKCEIDLDQDFATRTDALNFIKFALPDEAHYAIEQELYNADDPNVWIRFRIAGNLAILAIQL